MKLCCNSSRMHRGSSALGRGSAVTQCSTFVGGLVGRSNLGGEILWFPGSRLVPRSAEERAGTARCNALPDKTGGASSSSPVEIFKKSQSENPKKRKKKILSSLFSYDFFSLFSI